jgi:molybdenum-dependent DNA-binding transcriptional regulator ModE
MRASHGGHARRYLYELLTGCNLRTAPPPYQITSADAQARYHEFTIGMPAGLASALREHARQMLGTCGIRDEPLEWQPPPGWVTATTWPGADPACTDPAPIHHALLDEHTPPGQIAANLGISPDHLRQVLRYHPLPRPLRPIRRTLIPKPPPASPPSGQQPGVLYLDPAWLREEYLTWHRSLDDIAAQIGCPIQTLNRFAHQHGIPVRPRGSSIFIASRAAPGHHPRDLPEPLRHALTGRRARRRIHRLLVIAEHASILQAAQALGLWPSILYTQLARLEHACGGPLIRRSPRPPGARALTPLGQQLCQQARDYLGLQAQTAGVTAASS